MLDPYSNGHTTYNSQSKHIRYVGRDSSVGIATLYGLDGPGIEFLPIPVAERSKARVCGRLLVGIVGSIPPGAWMFVLCVAQ